VAINVETLQPKTILRWVHGPHKDTLVEVLRVKATKVEMRVIPGSYVPGSTGDKRRRYDMAKNVVSLHTEIERLPKPPRPAFIQPIQKPVPSLSFPDLNAMLEIVRVIQKDVNVITNHASTPEVVDVPEPVEVAPVVPPPKQKRQPLAPIREALESVFGEHRELLQEAILTIGMTATAEILGVGMYSLREQAIRWGMRRRQWGAHPPSPDILDRGLAAYLRTARDEIQARLAPSESNHVEPPLEVDAEAVEWMNAPMGPLPAPEEPRALTRLRVDTAWMRTDPLEEIEAKLKFQRERLEGLQQELADCTLRIEAYQRAADALRELVALDPEPV
jgi:hypothetical protein